MCAPCCIGCCTLRTSCCRPPLEKLRPVDNYHWFQHCLEDGCTNCKNNLEDGRNRDGLNCDCICRRNRHIIEALSCLFKCSVQYMVSLLFKLAYQQMQPLKRFPRDRVWDVMEHVKAPYTELNDLEIYDSMYDRCGQPIDPLDVENTNKILRLMFLTPVLTPDQHKYLFNMLEKLNERAYCPVHLDLLLQTIQTIDIKKLVCGLRNQEQLARRLYTGQQCNAICKLYSKVATADKHVIARNRRKRKFKRSGSDPHGDELSSARQSVLNRQFCERKPDNIIDLTPPRSTIRSIHLSRNSGSKNTRHSSTGSKFFIRRTTQTKGN